MVFVVLTRHALDETEPRVVVRRDAVWAKAGVLSESEVSRLRGLGWELTTWTAGSLLLAVAALGGHEATCTVFGGERLPLGLDPDCCA